ncbi:MAG: dihydroorotate dehydrogenase B catalytic subunit [Candidatus Omnitrophica bacterium CG11_big_fil_rev_8_21_14_0_20_63_9]|nr:MAG: dihydroorotate dehydrogenase B catalytic subunit [Candidatus Omnitrophica bacterium CG11_big_fil_rev_8_21_14_0_20_63_9]
MSDLRISLGPLQLANPVLAAAGTLGYGVEFARALPLHELGAIVTKPLTLRPRGGSPPPRLAETPSGMLNAVGLQNIGLDAFLSDKLPALRAHRVPVIVSLLGESPEEAAQMAASIERADGAAAIELNLSCPNIRHGAHAGAPPGFVWTAAQDAEATEAYVRAAVSSTRKPVIAKLSPDVTDLVPIAQAAERAGAAALTIGNTFAAMSIDAATRRSRLGAMTGGLSGPAIRALAVYRVWYTARSVRLPIIGLGGVVRAEDAVEFFLAGATAVAVGTATFADPKAPVRVLRGLARCLARHGMTSIQQLRGALVS